MADWSLYARGLSLFPLLTDSKRPAVEWEQYQSQRAEPSAIQAWSTGPWNTGVATGAVSGCFVFEVDSMERWAEAQALGLPETFTVKSPRGWHYYFQHPGGTVRNRAGLRLDPADASTRVIGWDVRGDGGYVVGPGSSYTPTPDEAAKGKIAGVYTIETDAPLAPAPDWLLRLVTGPAVPPAPPAPRVSAEITSAYGLRALQGECADLSDAQPGTVNDTINRCVFAIAQLVAGGEIREDEARGAIEEALASLGVADEEKALGTVERAWAAGYDVPRAGDQRQALVPAEVFGTRDAVPPAPPGMPAPPPPAAVEPYGPRWQAHTLGDVQLGQYFAGCVYIVEENLMWTPDGALLKRPSFDGLYGGPTFYRGAQGDKPTESAWEAVLVNQCFVVPKVHNMCFRPELPPASIVQINGKPYLNAYLPAVVQRTPGDPSPFLQHVARLLPAGQDAEYLLHWMASAVQNPGAKFAWWPVVQGVKGNGKSLLLDVMIEAVGENYTHLVRAGSLLKTGNQFNAWIARKLFLGFEEIHTSEGRRDLVDMLKDTVTGARIAAEGKGTAQATVDNRANGLMLTNYADAVPVDDDERRWGIFHTAQQRTEHLERDGMTGDYFPRLYGWLRSGGFAIVSHYLATRPLDAAMDPARGLHRAPHTTTYDIAKAESLGRIEQEVAEAIAEERVGFRGGWISSIALRRLLEERRLRLSPHRRPAMLQALGYERHPGVLTPDGRMNNRLADGSKPVLYICRDHASAGETNTAEIGRLFEAAQAEGGAASNVVAFPGRR